MATTPAASSRRRTTKYFKFSPTQHVELKVVASSYSAALKTAIGMVDDVPDTSIAIASGKADALARGLFFLVVEYQATPTQTQTAKIPVAPDKADTAYTALLGLTYRGKDIKKVRVPRRRVFVV